MLVTVKPYFGEQFSYNKDFNSVKDFEEFEGRVNYHKEVWIDNICVIKKGQLDIDVWNSREKLFKGE